MDLDEARFIDNLLRKYEFEQIYKNQVIETGTEFIDEFLLDKQKNLGIVIKYMNFKLEDERRKIRGYDYPAIVNGEIIKEYAKLKGRIDNNDKWLTKTSYTVMPIGVFVGGALGLLGFPAYIALPIIFTGIGVPFIFLAKMGNNIRKRDKIEIIRGKKALDILLEEYKT